jgi:hypothetical protein
MPKGLTLAELIERNGRAVEPIEREGRKRAALRLFLRRYREKRSDLLGSLNANVSSGFGETGYASRFREAYLEWLKAFRVPETTAMLYEALHTIRAWHDASTRADTEAAQLRWWWECVPCKPSSQYPFSFRAAGWSPANETVTEATKRRHCPRIR